MIQQGGTAENQIEAVIEAWANAVRRHDLSGIVAHHQQDVVMFDVPAPLQSGSQNIVCAKSLRGKEHAVVK